MHYFSKGLKFNFQFTMIESVEFLEAIVIFKGFLRVFEADISSFWIKIDSQIVWLKNLDTRIKFMCS